MSGTTGWNLYMNTEESGGYACKQSRLKPAGVIMNSLITLGLRKYIYSP